jgi:signal transduction histidine kinase
MLKLSLSPPIQTALLYLVISALWILFSDRLLDAFVTDRSLLNSLQTLKGWVFAGLTAVILYLLSRRQMKHIEQKNAELEAWAHRLEVRVEERTADLNAANTRLRELDTLKSKLISEISHELRSPLTSIGLKIELMERVDPSRRGEYIIGLKEQVLLLRELVNDVMDISTLENGGSAPEWAMVDLHRLAREVVEEHRPIAEATDLKLVYEVESTVPPVWGRHSQLSRMLANLVTNAIKYTSQGSVQVRLSADTAGNTVVFQVKDTGIGIAANDLKHLFERFYRSQRVKELHMPGSGLGLSIVKEIVEAHKGTINVESILDQGTTFTVKLPVNTP